MTNHHHSLKKIIIPLINHRLISASSPLLRHLSTVAPPPERIDKHTLYKMIPVGSGSASDVLTQLTSQGKLLHNTDLVACVKKLRKFRRYRHCLEILEWMEKDRVDRTGSTYALRLGVLCNIKGIKEAEKFFDSLPPTAKNRSTYGALLSCYCSEKMADKASTLFGKMQEMNYASSHLPFDNLMGLCMKIGRPEGVLSLVQEMKQKNIPLSNFSYSIWLQSYGCLHDLEGVERVLDEVREQESLKGDWMIHSNLVAVYLKVGQSKKAEAALEIMEEALDNSYKTDQDAYLHTISFSASCGDLERVTRVWKKFKSKFKLCNNQSYLNMLNALSKLDDIEGLRKCFKEWESSYQSYDIRVLLYSVGAHLKHGMVEEAELLIKDSKDKAGSMIWRAHVCLANYYLGNSQIDSALRHLEVARATPKKGKRLLETIGPFFEYFKEGKDVVGTEEFCSIIKKVRPLDSKTYLWLLRNYAAADETVPELRQMMLEDGVKTETEHEELLQKVCPS